MSPSRLKSISSPSKHSIISLSSFETHSSLVNDQFIVFNHNTNNNKSYLTDQKPINTKSLDQTLDQAVECFEDILNQCITHSNTSFKENNLLELKKRDCENFLYSIDRKENISLKQQEMKINCRQWCEEQNRRMAKSSLRTNETTVNKLYLRNQRSFGSIFFCRKALLQKSNGTTYICIRKRFN